MGKSSPSPLTLQIRLKEKSWEGVVWEIVQGEGWNPFPALFLSNKPGQHFMHDLISTEFGLGMRCYHLHLFSSVKIIFVCDVTKLTLLYSCWLQLQSWKFHSSMLFPLWNISALLHEYHHHHHTQWNMPSQPNRWTRLTIRPSHHN